MRLTALMMPTIQMMVNGSDKMPVSKLGSSGRSTASMRKPNDHAMPAARTCP